MAALFAPAVGGAALASQAHAAAAPGGGLQQVLADLGVSRVEGLEKYAQIAGVKLGGGDDQPAFDAAMAAMKSAGPGGLYVKVPAGRYRLRRLRIGNRSGFFCDPKSVILEQLPPADHNRPEVFVALSDPLATAWLFYGFALRGGWTHGRPGYSGRNGEAAPESDPWLFRYGAQDATTGEPEADAYVGQTALRLHCAFSGEADRKYRANSPIGSQNPRGRVGELEIEGFGGDGANFQGAGVQLYGPIQVYRVGGRGLYVNGYDSKLAFVDVGETGLEGIVLGPNGSSNTMVAFKAWYSGGRRVAGHTSALRMDRCSSVQLFGQLQDASGTMITAHACRGCVAIINMGYQGKIDSMDDDIAALALDGDARNNTFMINAAIGPWPMQAFPMVRKLLKCKADGGKRRPRRNVLIFNHEGWPDDQDVWNPAWFEGPMDGNLVIANDQIRQPGQWAPADDGRLSFGLTEPGGLGLTVSGRASAQPGQVALIHHDTVRIDHYADGIYTNALTAGRAAVSLGLPLRLKSYTVDTVPSASASGAGAAIYVVDEIGGAQGAKSDGQVWRRDTDRAVIQRSRHRGDHGA